MHSHKSSPKPNLKSNHKSTTFDFGAIGTVWKIEIYDPVAHRAALEDTVMQRIAAFDKNYSRFRRDSLVTKMADRVGTYKLPKDAWPMLDFYHELYELTGGAVTPLIGQVLADAGYDADYSLETKAMHSPPQWEEVLEYNAKQLTLRKAVLLDFGAAGKGYLVDIIGELLNNHEITKFFIDAGGDMLHSSGTGKEGALEPLEIGLEHPDDASMAIGIAHISNQALCGSAGNRRAWGEFHHIIDPYSLRSPKELRAVWVTAANAMLADGLATALFFAPAEVLQKRYDFEYALVRDDYSLERSNGFPATFFT